MLGKSTMKAKKKNPEVDRIKVDEFSPYSELCLLVDKYDLEMELEKPFVEFNQMILRVSKDGEVLAKAILNDITFLNEESAKLVNELGKKFW